MATSAALFTTLFLGGWHLPIPGIEGHLSGNLLAVAGILSFCLKVAAYMFFFVWVRWTLPRFRYDQLMNLGWKVLIPLAFANIFLIGGLVALGVPGWGGQG